MDAAGVTRWLAGYEQAWRSPGTGQLASLFTQDASYSVHPYAQPLAGLAAIARMWEAERDGPGEVFTMTSQVVAVAGEVAVVRVQVGYGEPVTQEFRDLWIISFAADGRCAAFEEWPFAPPRGRQLSRVRRAGQAPAPGCAPRAICAAIPSRTLSSPNSNRSSIGSAAARKTLMMAATIIVGAIIVTERVPWLASRGSCSIGIPNGRS